MTQSFYLTGEITAQNVVDLMSFVNAIYGDAPATIYINSPGGDLYCCDVIIDLLNRTKRNITLIASGAIQSGAFMIFFKYTGNREIMPGCRGMFHQGMTPLNTNLDGRLTFYNEIALMKNNRQYHYKFALKFCRDLGFKKREFRKLRKGHDVNFKYKRMKQLLAYSICSQSKSTT